MTIFVAIVGLGLLVFVHELGHFVASLALRMRPRKFYIGFPPAVVKRTRNGIEYGIGMIPLGGFVKIPGMHRPAAGDVDPVFGRAIEEAPELAGAADRLRRALDAGDHDAARASLAAFAELAGAAAAVGAGALRGREGRHRHRGCPRAGRVLASPHVEARARDLRRARREHRARARPLHGALHDLRAGSRRRRSRASARGRPPRRSGSGPATGSSRSTACR